MGKIKRYGLGGVLVNVTPDFQKGMMKGVVKAIRANKQDGSVVCRVKYETNKDKTVCDAWKKSGKSV